MVNSETTVLDLTDVCYVSINRQLILDDGWLVPIFLCSVDIDTNCNVNAFAIMPLVCVCVCPFLCLCCCCWLFYYAH